MKPDHWIDHERIIDQQLELQVEISFQRHQDFMLRHGLAKCHSILDIGTGNGLFLHQLATAHPEMKFFGVDNKLHMIDRAAKQKAPNIEWILADIADPETLPHLSQIDGILMRYLVLHLPNVQHTLSDLARRMKKGSRLWIFDLELDHFKCKPSHRGFDLLKNLVERFCEKYSMDSRAGSHMPRLLQNARWLLEAREIEPFTNQDTDKELFQKFIYREAMLYNYFLEESPDSHDMKIISDFIDNQAASNDYRVQYGMVMLAAYTG